MGAFDDLIPKSDATASIGAFDDLIPQEQPHNTPQQAGNPYGVQPQGISALSKDEYEDLPSNGLGILSQAAQGASLGFADEGQAAVVSMFSNKTYKQARDEIREFNAEFAEENPMVAMGAQVLGGGGLARGAAKAGSALINMGASNIMAGTATAAGGGFVAGAGYSEGETAGEVLADSGQGALFAAPFGVLGGVIRNRLVKSAKQDKFIKEIISNEPDARVVQAMVRGGAKFDKHQPLIKAASKQGFDDASLAVVMGADKPNKSRMRKMLVKMTKGRQNALYELDNRPSDVIGQSLSTRLDHVKKINRESASQIREAAGDLSGVDTGQAKVIASFRDDLESMGVKFTDEGLDFKGSDFESFGASKTLIKRVFDKSNKVSDGEGAHELKQFIDRFINYGKSNFKSADKEALDLVGGLRRQLDDGLDGFSASYDQANIKYKDTITSITNINKLLGKNKDFKGADLDRALGLLSRRVSSNAGSGVGVSVEARMLDEVATKYGGQFDDDFKQLVVFSNMLERRFGTSAPTSLQGAQQNALERIPTGAGDLIKEGGRALMNKVTRVDDDRAIDALRGLLTVD